VIEISSHLLYEVELEMLALEDNPSLQLDRQQKRQLLQRYNEAWLRLQQLEPNGENVQTFQIDDGPAWELAGGVLGQSSRMRHMRFHQLGSELRGISKKTWDVELDFLCRDFTMDPGQDLLVVLRDPQDEDGL
jgi:hypothetical protein